MLVMDPIPVGLVIPTDTVHRRAIYFIFLHVIDGASDFVSTPITG